MGVNKDYKPRRHILNIKHTKKHLSSKDCVEIFPKSHRRQTGFPTDSVSHLALASEPGSQMPPSTPSLAPTDLCGIDHHEMTISSSSQCQLWVLGMSLGIAVLWMLTFKYREALRWTQNDLQFYQVAEVAVFFFFKSMLLLMPYEIFVMFIVQDCTVAEWASVFGFPSQLYWNLIDIKLY